MIYCSFKTRIGGCETERWKKHSPRVVMRMAVWASRLMMGCIPIATARQVFALRHALLPRRLEPRSAVAKAWTGCHDGENGIAMPVLGRCGPGTQAYGSVHPGGQPALLSRSLSTSVSRLDATGEGPFLPRFAARGCKVGLCAGWQGGSWGSL